jgi:glycerophosphoryl diester phosphodiesterase
MSISLKKSVCFVSVIAAMTVLSACHPGEKGSVQATVKLSTLDGQPPLVLSHRGLPGLYPEETQLAYGWATTLTW